MHLHSPASSRPLLAHVIQPQEANSPLRGGKESLTQPDRASCHCLLCLKGSWLTKVEFSKTGTFITLFCARFSPHLVARPQAHSFFFFFNKFIYLFIFIFGCVGSSFLCEGFLQLWRAGATLHRGARASHHQGLSLCGAQAPDAQAQ